VHGYSSFYPRENHLLQIAFKQHPFPPIDYLRALQVSHVICHWGRMDPDTRARINEAAVAAHLPLVFQSEDSGVYACGPTSASIECMTLDYIPPVTFVPNIFSPNNDGINDVFYIQSNAQVTEVKSFRIYDRWGAVVFEDLNFLTNDPQHGWDGSYGGRELDPAVFVYAIVVETIDDRQLILKGDVALIR
jgi:gliding motility-associated-like protein